MVKIQCDSSVPRKESHDVCVSVSILAEFDQGEKALLEAMFLALPERLPIQIQNDIARLW
jgi:hypothetical protein